MLLLPAMPPLCNSPIERRNQSKIHYTLRVSPVPSSTRLASTASPLDRRITTGPGKLIPALFWINLSQIHPTAILLCLALILLSTTPVLLKCMHAWHRLPTVREPRADAGQTPVLASSRMSSVVQRTHIEAGSTWITALDLSNRIHPSIDNGQTVMAVLQACSWQAVINLLSTKG